MDDAATRGGDGLSTPPKQLTESEIEQMKKARARGAPFTQLAYSYGIGVLSVKALLDAEGLKPLKGWPDLRRGRQP